MLDLRQQRCAIGSWVSAVVGRCLQEVVWRAGLLVYRRWFSLRVHGRHHLPSRGPYLLVSNHASHLDGPAILAAHGKHYRRVFSLGARDYFFRGSVRSWISTYLLNMVPIDRRRPDFSAVNRCRQIADRGEIILMFPEGTRSPTGELQPFKLGLGLIAQRLGIAIVPVFVHGTFEALPKGAAAPKRRRIDVIFGEPIGGAPARTAPHRLSYLETAAEVFHAVSALRITLVESLRGGKRVMEWDRAPLPQYLLP